MQGEWELEYFGTTTFDHDHDKNDIQEHEVSVGYGVNNWWSSEFYGLFDKQPDESVRLTGLQLENRFQFTEPGEYWVDPGLLLAYTHAAHKDDPDGLEVKLLLEKQTGRFLHRANIGFEQESGSDSAATMAAGGALGLALGATMSALMYFGLLRIPTRHLFKVTSWLIALLAAGMAAQTVAFLQQADVVTSLAWVVWNTSHIVSDGSILGKVLHTLIGYTDRPTAMQLVVYVTTLASIFTLMRLFGGVPQSPQQARSLQRV